MDVPTIEVDMIEAREKLREVIEPLAPQSVSA